MKERVKMHSLRLKNTVGPIDLKEPGRITLGFLENVNCSLSTESDSLEMGLTAYHSQRHLGKSEVYSGLRAYKNNSSAFKQQIC